MVITFAAVNVLAGLCFGNQLVELAPYGDSVDHLILGAAGMYLNAMNGDVCVSRVEGLGVYLAGGLAVKGVGKIGVEIAYIVILAAFTDLLIGSKANLDGAVLYFRMGCKIFDHVHDLCNAGLVVCAEQSGAVGNDKVLTYVVEHMLEYLCSHYDVFFRVEHDVLAVIVLYYAGSDIGAGSIGSGIHVSYKANDRRLGIAICGNGRIYAAGIIQPDIGGAQFFQLFYKHSCQILLLFGCGYGGAVMYGLSIHLDVAKEAFDNV